MRQYLTSFDWSVFMIVLVLEIYVLRQVWWRTTTMIFPTMMGYTLIELGAQFLAVMLGATPLAYAWICALLQIGECLFLAAAAVELATRLMPRSKFVMRTGPVAMALPMFCGLVTMPPINLFAVFRMAQLAMMLSLMVLLGCLARDRHEPETKLAGAYAAMMVLIAIGLEMHLRLWFSPIGRRAEPIAWLLGLIIVAWATRRTYRPAELLPCHML